MLGTVPKLSEHGLDGSDGKTVKSGARQQMMTFHIRQDLWGKWSEDDRSGIHPEQNVVDQKLISNMETVVVAAYADQFLQFFRREKMQKKAIGADRAEVFNRLFAVKQKRLYSIQFG